MSKLTNNTPTGLAAVLRKRLAAAGIRADVTASRPKWVDADGRTYGYAGRVVVETTAAHIDGPALCDWLRENVAADVLDAFPVIASRPSWGDQGSTYVRLLGSAEGYVSAVLARAGYVAPDPDADERLNDWAHWRLTLEPQAREFVERMAAHADGKTAWTGTAAELLAAAAAVAAPAEAPADGGAAEPTVAELEALTEAMTDDELEAACNGPRGALRTVARGERDCRQDAAARLMGERPSPRPSAAVADDAADGGAEPTLGELFPQTPAHDALTDAVAAAWTAELDAAGPAERCREEGCESPVVGSHPFGEAGKVCDRHNALAWADASIRTGLGPLSRREAAEWRTELLSEAPLPAEETAQRVRVAAGRTLLVELEDGATVTIVKGRKGAGNTGTVTATASTEYGLRVTVRTADGAEYTTNAANVELLAG